MGDSDDDYDRRRRDKFRGERNDYDNRRPPPSRGYDRGRGDRSWNNDRGGSKRDYYGNSNDQRDRRDKNFGGRGSSPPSKRSKRDWDGGDSQWRTGGQESSAMIPADKGPGPGTSPSLMSFKGFIIQQEDDIDETEAVRRYHEYKVEFKRTQINDFFVLHKGEEWFQEKYHPIKSVDRKKLVRQGIRKRLRVFLDLWEAGYLDDISLQITNNHAILKILDKVLVKLEGYDDEEINALDYPPKRIEEQKQEEDKGEDKSAEVKKEVDGEQTKNYTYDADAAEDDNENEAKEPLPPGMDEDDEDLKPPGMDEDEEDKSEVKEEIKEEDDEKEKKVFLYEGFWPKRPVSIFIRNLANSITREDLVNVCKRYPGFLRVGLSEAAAERRYSRRGWVTFAHDTNIKDVCWNLSNIRVKELELAPTTNREVNNRVRPVNGVSCSPMAMQLDINYILKLIRKLDARLRLYEADEVNGHTDNDDDDEGDETEENNEKLKEQPMDEETEESEEKPKDDEEKNEEAETKTPKDEIIELPDENPILAKLPDHIEELITGLELGDEEDDKKEYPIVVNEELRQWLDVVVLYLRVVHCIDYYNAIEYIHEEEMPVKCGILHVRCNPLEVTSKKDVHEYFDTIKTKLENGTIVPDPKFGTDEEAERLGRKNEETEIENFIKANTQELAKDKWLCPLSGKKFRGPEFVRKHILMKHIDSVDNVKTEVKYFNNYIYDLGRPCFPEGIPKMATSGGSSGGSAQRSGATPSSSSNSWQGRQPPMYPGKPAPKSNYSTPQPPNMPQETYGRMNTFPPKQMRRGGGSFRDRKIIKYRDLDAPEESDFF